MAKTLDDLIARLRHKLALPSDDQLVPDSDLTISINNGMNAMAADYDWPWLFTSATITTVAGTVAYSLPTRHMRTLWIANEPYGYQLVARQRKQLSRYYGTNFQQDYPFYYTVYGAGIRLAPIPNAVYSLSHTYVAAEAPLTTGAQEPLCPEHFSDLIVLYAGMEEATRLKDFQQRNAFMQDAQTWKLRIKDQIRQEASTLRVQTRGDWSVG